jgi:hypothetical protein
LAVPFSPRCMPGSSIDLFEAAQTPGDNGFG